MASGAEEEGAGIAGQGPGQEGRLMEQDEIDVTGLVTALKNSIATIEALYVMLKRVEDAGGAMTISGIAACHTMLTSMRTQAPRIEKLVLAPAKAEIAKTRREG